MRLPRLVGHLFPVLLKAFSQKANTYKSMSAPAKRMSHIFPATRKRLTNKVLPTNALSGTKNKMCHEVVRTTRIPPTYKIQTGQSIETPILEVEAKTTIADVLKSYRYFQLKNDFKH